MTMNNREKRALEILGGLCRLPAVPFHEDAPAAFIMETLDALGVPAFRDGFGNIVARYLAAPADGGDPPIAFVAHMDHPGFETVGTDDSGAPVAAALGGVPQSSLLTPVDVFAHPPDGTRLAARIEPLDPDARKVRLTARGGGQLDGMAPRTPVSFDLTDFELDGDMIRARALDDLAGCAASLAALERLAADGADADAFAVFTRAEEGGLFGARLMAQARTLPPETLIVSIESSPLIPGVEQGAGPVIRTGDALYTFDADAEQALIVARDAIRQRDPSFRCQRQLMSGGVCEATAFAVWGYRATGVAFPLGNYHNATTNVRDPQSGVGAEFIRADDFLGGVSLLAEAAVSVGKRQDSPARARVRETPPEIRARMSETPAAPR